MKESTKKAKEIIDKYKHIIYSCDDAGYLSDLDVLAKAKECAIICVDEIIKTLQECETYKDVNPNLPIVYWQEVRQEIINYK